MDWSDFLLVFFIALCLSVDCFAVALSGSISLKSFSLLRVLRVSSSFGLFQALMPVIGWLAGRAAVEFIGNYDHWVALALLVVVGGRMMWESFRGSPEKSIDITKGFMLLTLSVATSLDALAVGLTFALLEVDIRLSSLTIGVVAFVVTLVGFMLGRKVGSVVGKRAEFVGGVILISIGLRIFLSHVIS